jgi:hypothetical protein
MARSAIGTVLVCQLSFSLARGLAPPPQTFSTSPAKSLMAEQFFNNVQLLRGMPVHEFMETMGFIAAKATFQSCDDPQHHSADIYAKAPGP